MIVVEAKELDRIQLPVECEACGKRTVVTLTTELVETQIEYRAHFAVCCESVEQKSNKLGIPIKRPN